MRAFFSLLFYRRGVERTSSSLLSRYRDIYPFVDMTPLREDNGTLTLSVSLLSTARAQRDSLHEFRTLRALLRVRLRHSRRA